VRICERNNSADTRVSAEGGGGGAAGAGAEILLQRVEKAMVRQAVPCSPWKSTVEQINTCSPGRTLCLKEAHAGAGSWEVLCPMERGAQARAGLLAGLVTLWRTHTGAACS